MKTYEEACQEVAELAVFLSKSMPHNLPQTMAGFGFALSVVYGHKTQMQVGNDIRKIYNELTGKTDGETAMSDDTRLYIKDINVKRNHANGCIELILTHSSNEFKTTTITLTKSRARELYATLQVYVAP